MKKTIASAIVFFWHAGRDVSFAKQNPPSSRQSRSDLVAKNSPPDCLLNASTLSGFESLPVNKNKDKPTARVNLSLFGTPEGIRTPDLLVRSNVDSR